MSAEKEKFLEEETIIDLEHLQDAFLADTTFKFKIPLDSITCDAESLLDDAENLSAPLSPEIITNISMVVLNMIRLRDEYNSFYGNLKEYNRVLEKKILERTKKLDQKNRSLEKALNRLKQSQARLIQSEKMVALGQLIAGIAHEINTPLGVIRGASNNVSNSLGEIILKIPELFKILSGEKLDAFIRLLQDAFNNEEKLSAREARKTRLEIKKQLENAGVESAAHFADTLVDMGICRDISPFLPLLKEKDASTIFQLSYAFCSLKNNSQNIISAVDRASKIVFALKKYVHRDHDDKKVLINLTDGIETVLTLYYNRIKQGIKIVKKYDNVPMISGYPDELNQVWTNLIQNAFQAMNYKGCLEIRVIQTGGYVNVLIIDDGPGISQEIKQRIFEPFFTTKSAGEGSGLGLDICKKIVERHNGKIQFGSKAGRTIFRIMLPISIEE